MKIIFVRHGHPNYASGHLTDLGHLHAKAAAERLVGDGIEKIYSSPLTRAVETAEYTAKKLKLDIEILECIHEIAWGSIDEEPILEKGHPWNIADIFSATGRSLADSNWGSKEPFCRNKILQRMGKVISGFDAWMASMGYERNGEFYRVTGEDTDKTVAIFGHGGSFTTIFAHLMNIPFPLACRVFDLNFTSITVAKFDNVQGVFCIPRFDVIGDAHHIKGIEIENTFLS